MPDPLPTADATANEKLASRVTIGGTSVSVVLSNEWRAGGEVVVVLRNVTAAVPRSLTMNRPNAAPPYHSYPVTVKSKRSGRLDLLDPILIDHDGDGEEADPTDTDEVRTKQPIINVGNILGSRIDNSTAEETDGSDKGVHHYGPDQIARNFKIEQNAQDVVYEGETDKTFKVTFEAQGPMYSIPATDADTDDGRPVSIAITIPPEIQGDAITPALPLSAQNVSVIARGRVLPSGSLSVGPTTW